MAYPRFQRSRDFKFTKRTAGDLATVNTGSGVFVSVDTALDLTLAAQAGDTIEYHLGALLGTENFGVFFDVGTIVSAAVVNRFTGAITQGWPGWYGVGGRLEKCNGPAFYQLVSGDLSATGTVTLRLLYSAAGIRTIYASTASNLWLTVAAKNIGPKDPN